MTNTASRLAFATASLVASSCTFDGPASPAARPAVPAAAQRAVDPLPSWDEGATKQALLDFVASVTTAGPDFVPESERIAVFDNDGTLWTEQPIYVQLAFAVDRVRALSPHHPEWTETQPFADVLIGNLHGIAQSGEEVQMKLLAATHAGMTTAEFAAIANEFIETARHPRFDRPYTDLVYQPMLELLAHLRGHEFKTFIVSGGGVEFMRPWAEEVYGIPPEQVIGSRIEVRYEPADGEPALRRLPELDLVDDGAGKPVGIHQVIGRRPIAAFGNSDGDFEMLEWVTSGEGPRLGVLVHHTDAEREWAYDRRAHVGRLAKALDAAPERGWVVVDMKDDWSVVYPFQR